MSVPDAALLSSCRRLSRVSTALECVRDDVDLLYPVLEPRLHGPHDLVLRCGFIGLSGGGCALQLSQRCLQVGMDRFPEVCLRTSRLTQRREHLARTDQLSTQAGGGPGGRRRALLLRPQALAEKVVERRFCAA